MHLIKSLSGLLNQKAWRANRRLAHWAEYLKLNFGSYSPKACVSFLSTLNFCGESWFNDLASPGNCVTSWIRKSPQSWVYPVLDVLSFWHNWIHLVNYGRKKCVVSMLLSASVKRLSLSRMPYCFQIKGCVIRSPMKIQQSGKHPVVDNQTNWPHSMALCLLSLSHGLAIRLS